jgi:hypothetical protein
MNEIISLDIIPSALSALKILVAGSIFYVWVIKFQNIIDEFKGFELPDWLRDLVGILKLSFALMLQSSDMNVVLMGSFGIAILMVAALLTHLRVKNPFYKMLPAMSLLAITSVIFLNSLKF